MNYLKMEGKKKKAERRIRNGNERKKSEKGWERKERKKK